MTEHFLKIGVGKPLVSNFFFIWMIILCISADYYSSQKKEGHLYDRMKGPSDLHIDSLEIWLFCAIFIIFLVRVRFSWIIMNNRWIITKNDDNHRIIMKFMNNQDFGLIIKKILIIGSIITKNANNQWCIFLGEKLQGSSAAVLWKTLIVSMNYFPIKALQNRFLEGSFVFIVLFVCSQIYHAAVSLHM